jgi:hypothetical protein
VAAATASKPQSFHKHKYSHSGIIFLRSPQLYFS